MNINIDLAKDTLCKNILIYGYCKYENKGCVFSHHLNKPSSAGSNHPSSSGGASLQTSSNGNQSGNASFNRASSGTASYSLKQAIINTSNNSHNAGHNPNHISTNPTINSNSNNGNNGNSNSVNNTSNASNAGTQSAFASANYAANSNSGSSTFGNKKFNFNTPSFQPASFQPQSKFSASPNINKIQTFIPESSIGTGVNSLTLAGSGVQPTLPLLHPMTHQVNTTAGGASITGANTSVGVPSAGSGIGALGAGGALFSDQSYKKFNTSTPSFTPSSYTPEPQPNIYAGAPTTGQDYFNQRTYPLQYHLYAPAPPPRLTVPPPPFQTNLQLMFIPNKLRERLTKKNEATLQTIPGLTLPEHVNVYHLLVPIDTQISLKSKIFNYKTTNFKAFLNTDGNAYNLLCVEDTHINNEGPFHTAKQWRSLQNSNIIKYYESFTLMAFGGKSSMLVIVYDYYPDSNTLQEQHISRKLGSKLQPVTEEVLISYIIQISSALQAIHSKGLAARDSMDLLKIIVTNKNRIRIGSLGLSDILSFAEYSDPSSTSPPSISELQSKDIKNFGNIILDLALTLLQPQSRQGIKSLRTFSTFSETFLNLLENLTTWNDNNDDNNNSNNNNNDDDNNNNNNDNNNINNNNSITAFIEAHLTQHLLKFGDSLQVNNDYMELQLTTELENARLFRLLSKIDFIAAHADAVEWQENGPKYVITLFKDYVFNEVNENRKPVLNLLRVLTCLNKLDAGIDEKILLVNKDETQCMVVSYKEVKELIGTTFRGLMK